MRVALDSNVLLYWLGLTKRADDVPKVDRTQIVVPALIARHDLVIPGQAIGEAYNVFTRAGETRERARDRLRPILQRFEVAAPTADEYRDALDLAVANKLQFWDALIVRIADATGCNLLLSEDMQNGFRIGGVTIVNPLTAPAHPAPANLLED